MAQPETLNQGEHRPNQVSLSLVQAKSNCLVGTEMACCAHIRVDPSQTPSFPSWRPLLHTMYPQLTFDVNHMCPLHPPLKPGSHL